MEGNGLGLIILTDSSSDLPLKYVEDNSNILRVVGMPIVIGEESYIDDLGKTLKHSTFYDKLESGIMPRTSQINVIGFLDEYKKAYENGDSLIYLGLSSGLSGTMNNAELAKQMLLEEYPDADISVIDTRAASGGLGAMVAHTVSKVKEGKSKEEVVDWINSNVLKFNHWFAVDDLEHLKNGGRIPAAIALLGTALKVKPVLTMSYEGKLRSYSSVRGRHKSIKQLYDKFSEHIGETDGKEVFICHANCIKDAEKLKKMIEETHNPKEIYITQLSATIGTHVGSGMLAVAFMGDKERENK